ncbi:2-aminoethylphosphonate--pyruvate transaminase [bacterium]|nr:2-aminoethylphosphonate--pyruvate transaminase [bacterium]
MSDRSKIDGWKDHILFTPGPLTTSRAVKQAMLRDLGARDGEYLAIIREIRDQLLKIANLNKGEYEAVLMQGCGTMGLESVVGSAIPPNGKFLVLANGAYGKRIAEMAKVLNIETLTHETPENQHPDLVRLENELKSDKAITHVCVVHCETTSGIVNPIEDIGRIVKQYNRAYFVDAMCSFGAMPIDFAACGIDYLVSSANKCIEGVPGFSYIIAKRDALQSTKGNARSLSMDLYNQWHEMEEQGHFRYTPPTHSSLAFHQALLELEQEGGVEARANRYKHNYEVLIEGMRKIGFNEYLLPELQGYIITTFLYPNHPNFDYEIFYQKLREKDQVIYSGKVSDEPCFRIGNIGRIFESDVRILLACIRETLQEMKIQLEPIIP